MKRLTLLYLRRRLDGEIDNLRAALAWSLTGAGDVEIGLAIAAELEWYWSVGGRIHEGRGWLESLLARTTVLAIAAMFEGDLPAPERYGQESLQLFRQLAHPDGIATAENCLGDVLRWQGRVQEAARHYEANLVQLERSGARNDLHAVLHNVAYGALAQGETTRAQTLLQQSLKLQRDSGNQRGIAECLCSFAALAVTLGQPAEAA